MTFSSWVALRSSLLSVSMSRYVIHERVPRRYQMCATGDASSMWPMRSRRTFERVTSTPQRSQMMPLKRTRL